MKEHVTMRSLQIEVHSYMEYHDNIMKVEEEILHGLNML
jgi:hypothetical protein